MPGMYQKALMRKRTGQPVPGLGQVVGVDVPYEENPEAECVLDALRPVEENARAVLEFLDAWLPGLPPEKGDAA
jgi:adenylylsulfate kinase